MSSSRHVVSEVVFFLGAGASMGAGVPDTFGFVKEFQHYARDSGYGDKVDRIVEVLDQWRESGIDVELLLETLVKLSRKDQEPLLRFVKDSTCILDAEWDKEPIAELLKDFIKEKATIRSQEKVRYLDALRGFIQQSGRIDIVSVNYDTCVEQFCSVHQLRYEDGFDISWNPQVFERGDSQVRLYKLHGSVIWYQSDRGDYIKLPLITNGARVRLFTGEQAESLMLYPMKKFDYPEPLLDLMVRVRNLLQNAQCKFLVVVGYSFRDEQVVRIVQDAARRNRELCVVLVDPRASNTYEERLKYYPPYGSCVPSSLNGRVVCLPYRFEDVLPILKDQYLGALRYGLRAVVEHEASEVAGSAVRWVECVAHLAAAEHAERLTSLMATHLTEDDLEEDWKVAADAYLKLAWNLRANGRLNDSNDYLTRLKKTLKRLLDEPRMEVQVLNEGGVVRLAVNPSFSYRLPKDAGLHRENTGTIVDFLEKENQYIRSRAAMVSDEGLASSFQFILQLTSHLLPFREGLQDYLDYGAGHPGYAREFRSLGPIVDQFISGGEFRQLKEKIERSLAEVESKIIHELLT